MLTLRPTCFHEVALVPIHMHHEADVIDQPAIFRRDGGLDFELLELIGWHCEPRPKVGSVVLRGGRRARGHGWRSTATEEPKTSQ